MKKRKMGLIITEIIYKTANPHNYSWYYWYKILAKNRYNLTLEGKIALEAFKMTAINYLIRTLNK